MRSLSLNLNLALRPFVLDDLDFLHQVYASTRQSELALVNWTEAEKTAFLKMQFEAQHQYYQQHYTQTSFDIILLETEPIGRLYVARWETEIRIVDITVLPAYRNRGIGSHLLKQLIAEGQQKRLPISIHVEIYNPALRLYERLGFTRIRENGVYWLMEKKSC